MNLLEVVKDNNPKRLRETGLTPYAIAQGIKTYQGDSCWANAFVRHPRHKRLNCDTINCTYCPFHQSRSKETVLEWLKHGYTVNDPKPKCYE